MQTPTSLQFRKALLLAAMLVQVASSRKMGIVTLQTPSIMNYANSTEAVNRRYAERWGYSFHVVDHTIDRERVPHWSKVHAVQLYLPEYDFLFWIDADAVFFDHSRPLDEVAGVDAQPTAHIWAQDIWPDYPSIQRRELVDTSTVLFRNSRWTREFLLEMYYFPPCQEWLNWTEQYCFTLAYRADLLGVQDRVAILPTPRFNHHILPPPHDPSALFVLHLAGRPSQSRVEHFAQVHDGRAEAFRQGQHGAFWDFYALFAQHSFGGVASLQACVFGLGARHREFLDALLFHFPYMSAFTVVLHGAPQLWSQLRASEVVGERFNRRLAHVDVAEYLLGHTRNGERFVSGLYCDLLVLGVESWRHLPSLDVLGSMSRTGLEPNRGDANHGFGYSPLRDVYFVWLRDGCDEKGGRLDGNDEDGSALAAACNMLVDLRLYVEAAAAVTSREGEAWEEGPTLWGIKAPGERGVVQELGQVALARVQREAFPAVPATE